MPVERLPLQEYDLERAIGMVQFAVLCALIRKGPGAFVSPHEILGILAEEQHEFLLEVQGNTSDEKKIGELLDIAVSAVWGIASIRAGAMSW